MTIPSLATLAGAFRHVRLALFLALLATSAWQVLTLLRGPVNAAPTHLLFAIVALVIAARLYLAKKSSFNQALNEIERLAAHRKQEV